MRISWKALPFTLFLKCNKYKKKRSLSAMRKSQLHWFLIEHFLYICGLIRIQWSLIISKSISQPICIYILIEIKEICMAMHMTKCIACILRLFTLYFNVFLPLTTQKNREYIDQRGKKCFIDEQVRLFVSNVNKKMLIFNWFFVAHTYFSIISFFYRKKFHNPVEFELPASYFL